MRRVLLSFIALLLIISSTHAQSVGVVMSGGGAKGLYHIGVLRALEENSIPIDYVSGTSMGAIIGGLYAAGYSPNEISDIATSGEIAEWMSGRIDNNYGAYFREHNQFFKDDPILSIRLNTKDKSKTLHLPQGIISSIHVDLALNNFLTPANVVAEGDFNELMVPFLCVASDVSTDRQKVVFRQGNLAQAVRASMALPVAFTPIKDGKRILYDGGIVDNFPWRPTMRAFDPDIMIGSSCSSADIQTEDISMIDHIFMLTMNRTNYNMPEDRSIFIERDVDAGTLDFSSSKEIIELGYNDTIERMDSIKSRITRRTTLAEVESRRKEFRAKMPEMIFDNYTVEGLSPEQMEYVSSYMATNRRNHNFLQREMTFDELKTNLFSILSSDNFSTEFPKIEYNQATQRYSFSIHLENKPSLKLSMGGNLSSTPFNQIYFGVDYTVIGSISKTAYAELYLGPVYTMGIIGGRVDIYRRSPLFFDAYACLSSKNLRHGNFGNLTDVDNTLSVRGSDNYISLGLGAPISNRMMFSARANFGRAKFIYDEVGTNTALLNISQFIDETNLRFSAVKGEVERITLDKTLFPTRGSKLNISAIFLHGQERNSTAKSSTTSGFETLPTITHAWWGARLKYEKYITSDRNKSWFSLGINVDGVYSTVDNFATDIATSLMLPAYEPTIHSKMVFMPEFSAKYFVAGGVIPQFTIAKNFYAQCGIFTMFRDKYIDEDGNTPYPIASEYSMQFIGDISFIYHTRFGPLSLALTKYNLSNINNLYLTFNFGHSIFAPKGMFY